MVLSSAVFLAVVASTPIRLDQIGYDAGHPKSAVVAAEGCGRRFTIRALPQGETVLAGMLPAPALDADSGERVCAADFSAVDVPGDYELVVEGLGRGAQFRIGSDRYHELLRSVARAYYGQRCGMAVDLGSGAPGYSHAACHQHEAFHRTSGHSGARPSTGGWHDAGDYGRYVVNSGITMGTMLWAFELFPDAWSKLDLAIPESGNATPDVLDEVRWNLLWMLSMQDDDGGAWQKETSEDFPSFIPADADGSVSYVIGTGSTPFKSSCATANLAAVAAIAGRVYRPYDTELAARSLAAAHKAWSWLAIHPDVVFRNPRGIRTGEYGDRDCSDERLWAAAELWRTSQDPEAGAWFRDHASAAVRAISSSAPPSWSHVGALAAWSYALGGGEPAIVASIRDRSIAAADEISARARRHAYRIPMNRRDYLWGSNGVAANYGLQLLVANAMRANPAYVDTTLDIIHYLLGRNPFALSWVTGAGSGSVRHPHHRPSAGLPAPWPGLLAGGPNQHRQDPALRRLPLHTPPAKSYVDEQESYASNEVAINWNAPLLFILAGTCESRP